MDERKETLSDCGDEIIFNCAEGSDGFSYFAGTNQYVLSF